MLSRSVKVVFMVVKADLIY